jgi:phosphoribosylglycinamide formyltransferase-1
VSLKEHTLYPIAVRWYLQGRLQLTGEGATLDGHAIPANGIQYTADLR